MSENRKIRRALVSLSDKTGAVDFVRSLVGFGVEIYHRAAPPCPPCEAGLR